MTDVLLLADVFADYRRRSYKTYGLDPIYCISSPGYANRAMLNYTNAEIKLITDVNIYLIIEKGIRGGRCEPMFIRAKANNKYINPNFTENRDIESYIVSLGVNSLYPTAMMYKLPYGEFQYDENISMYTNEYIMNININGDYLYYIYYIIYIILYILYYLCFCCRY